MSRTFLAHCEAVYKRAGVHTIIPARLLCLAREESRVPGPLARRPRAGVTEKATIPLRHFIQRTYNSGHYRAVAPIIPNLKRLSAAATIASSGGRGFHPSIRSAFALVMW